MEFDGWEKVVKEFAKKNKIKFYNLEELAREFVDKNRLPHIKAQTRTSIGEIVSLYGGSLFVLYLRSSDCLGSMPKPMFGGKGKHKYTEDHQEYILEGVLKGEQIRLEISVSETQVYKKERVGGLCNCCAPQLVADGEAEIKIERIDDSGYWFITEPKNRGAHS